MSLIDKIFCLSFVYERFTCRWYQGSSMPREYIILECTEAKKEGKPVSRYMSTRNKKVQTERVEKMKYNKFLKRHTLHREIKG